MLYSELYKQPRRYYAVNVSNFDSGDSPATIDIFTELSRNSIDGYLVCDGDGDILVSFSHDGTTYGENIVLKKKDSLDLESIDVHSVKITHSGADSSYRLFCL